MIFNVKDRILNCSRYKVISYNLLFYFYIRYTDIHCYELHYKRIRVLAIMNCVFHDEDFFSDNMKRDYACCETRNLLLVNCSTKQSAMICK